MNRIDSLADRRRPTYLEIQTARRRNARNLKIIKRAFARCSASQEAVATSEYLNLRVRSIDEAQRDIEFSRNSRGTRVEAPT